MVERGDATFDALLGNFRGLLAERMRAIVTITVTKALPLTSPAYDDGTTEPALRRSLDDPLPRASAEPALRGMIFSNHAEGDRPSHGTEATIKIRHRSHDGKHRMNLPTNAVGQPIGEPVANWQPVSPHLPPRASHFLYCCYLGPARMIPDRHPVTVRIDLPVRPPAYRRRSPIARPGWAFRMLDLFSDPVTALRPFDGVEFAAPDPLHGRSEQILHPVRIESSPTRSHRVCLLTTRNGSAASRFELFPAPMVSIKPQPDPLRVLSGYYGREFGQ